MARQAEHSEKVLFSVIPGEPKDCGRDPESRKVTGNQIILDPPAFAGGSRIATQPLTPEE